MRSFRGGVQLLGVVCVTISGCIPTPQAPVTVELVNSTSLDVRPNLYISSAATDPAGLFVAGNLVTDFTTRPFPELRANETATLTVECDQIQSVGVDEPVMFDAALVDTTVSADRIFLLRGTDFECGATLRFVFSTEDDEFGVRLDGQ
jgi:hypothetical protein